MTSLVYYAESNRLCIWKERSKNKPTSMISLVQSRDPWRQCPWCTRSLLRWEGFVEKVSFEPGVEEWRSDRCWEWWWWQRWVDNWMKRWIATRLMRLTEWIYQFIAMMSLNNVLVNNRESSILLIFSWEKSCKLVLACYRVNMQEIQKVALFLCHPIDID